MFARDVRLVRKLTISMRNTFGFMGLWSFLDSRLISGVVTTSETRADDAKSWLATCLNCMMGAFDLRTNLEVSTELGEEDHSKGPALKTDLE